MPMKVLHVIPSVSPVRGGPGHAVIDLVKALCDRNIETEIITTNDNGSELLDVPLGKLIQYKQVPIRFFPRFSPPVSFIQEFVFSRQLTQWLWQHIDEYDLIHLHLMFNYPCTAAMTIARIKKVPYIVRPNGLLCRWSLQQKSLKKRLYLQAIERANLDNSQALEFTAPLEQEEVAALGFKANNFILPYGLYLNAPIPDARYRLRQILQVPEDEPIILFMSRLHHKKGLEYLIPALQKLEHRRFTFLLAGSGDPKYEAQLQALLKSSGIEHRTYFAGFVAGERKNLFLQGSDIFALTSHSESFGLAVLEAISAGLSVVTTPQVPLASIVDEYQLGEVTLLNIDDIAISLNQCLDSLTDISSTQARQERSRQLIVEQYTWDAIADKMQEIYRTIIQQKSITSVLASRVEIVK
jgi:glycosyltransferase involved in cell wall biosynthesis